MLSFILASIIACSQQSTKQSLPSKPQIVSTTQSKDQKKKEPVGKVHSNFTVTAYDTSPGENGGYTITSTGHKLRTGIIAVDPRVIKMGSRIHVPGYGWGIADDRGGAIKGRHIDVCFSSRHMVGRWGRKKLDLIVIPPEKHNKKKK